MLNIRKFIFLCHDVWHEPTSTTSQEFGTFLSFERTAYSFAISAVDQSDKKFACSLLVAPTVFHRKRHVYITRLVTLKT